MSSRFLLVSPLLALMVSCGSPEKKSEANTEESIPVKTASVQVLTQSPAVEITGMVFSNTEARLSFPVGGLIYKTYVDEGAQVQAGQPLAELDPTLVKAQFNQARQAVEKATRDYERVKALLADSSATLELFQNAKTGLEVANENLSSARFALEHARISAPVTGKVIRKLMNAGENVGPGMPVYVVNASSSQDWVVKISLSDRDWARLNLKDRAEIELDAYPGKLFGGQISELTDAADATNGTFSAKIKLDPIKDTRLAAGLVARARIYPSLSQPMQVIPINALQEAGKKEGIVYSLNPDNKTVTRHTVHILSVLGDKVAISDSFDTQTRVITDGSAYLTPTSRVLLQP